MPLVQTRGAASAQGFGEFAQAGAVNYIEDVFSCFLYTGTGVAQTITNGIDLAGKGGLVWSKDRSAVQPHWLVDTVRGVDNRLEANSTGAQTALGDSFPAFYSNGYGLGNSSGNINTNGNNEVSWTFRKQPKFFDVVTYTGNGTSQNIAHNLGSVPGCIFVKRTNSTGRWIVHHRGLSSPNSIFLTLNSTASQDGNGDMVNGTSSTTFSVGSEVDVNASGGTYVAYLFAHNAGGFGLSGTDNVISCGSFTTGNGGKMSAPVNLGYEPQWLLMKNYGASENWIIYDTMRGLSFSGYKVLYPNLSNAEDSSTTPLVPTATGFDTPTASGPFASFASYIYIAIRRGPMKVPTLGTSVYNNLANRVGTSATATISGVGFPVDLMIPFNETSGSSKPFVDRLRGATKYLFPPFSNAEQTNTDVVTSFASNDGVIVGADATLQVINNYYNASRRYAASFFRRAPSVFDIVCYTGNGAGNNAITHNLNVAPELLIIKNRSSEASGDWFTFHNFTSSNFKKQLLDTTDAQTNYTYGSFLDAQPTNTTFTVNSGAGCNASGTTYVAYLFSTAGGVSKVGSYTGTGALQTINCGFTSGARFILIKRTDSTGNWYLYDSARGITSGDDPYLLLNTTGTSELGTNYVDTDSTGFKVTAAAPAELNANGGSFIFLAIA